MPTNIDPFLTTATAKRLCPECGKLIGAATSIDGEVKPTPERGVGVCLNCGTIFRFNKDLSIRKATSEELAQMMLDQEAWSAIQRLQAQIRRRGPMKESGNARA
jgi:hypothetical protein